MTDPAFKDAWPKDWRELSDHMEQFQEAEVRQINLERDQKAWLETTDNLLEAGAENWLVEQVTELYVRLVRK
jgi:hypothetical protein